MKSLVAFEFMRAGKRGVIVFNIIILILGSLCMEELASAQTPKIVVDDFNDGILDSTIWEVCSSDSSRYMIENNGRLEIHSAGVELSGPCHVMANSRVLLPVNQDFYLKVFFNAADCDDNSGVGLFLRNAHTDSKCFID